MSIDMVFVKSCIDFHLTKVKTTSDVAELLKISHEALRKAFVKSEKIPLRNYIFRRKVLLMQEMILMYPEMSLKWICYEAGLREDSGTRVFKKFTGVTMEEFSKTIKVPEKYKEFLLQRAKKIVEEKNYHA